MTGVPSSSSRRTLSLPASLSKLWIPRAGMFHSKCLPEQVLCRGKQMEGRGHRAQAGRDGVQLHPPAAFSGVLAERRRKEDLAPPRPGNRQIVHRIGQGEAVDERRPDELERPRGSPSLRKIGPLEEAGSGVKRRGLRSRHVRRRGDPRQPGFLPGHRPLPSAQLDDLQLGADSMDLVEEGGDLAHRQPVTDRDWVAADVGREGGIEEIPLQQLPSDRIRTVEKDE